MSTLRRFCLRVLHSLRPARAEAHVARELAAHLALLEDDYIARGLTPEAARREARRMLGGESSVRALHREARALPWLLDAAHDIRHAVRMLQHAPAYTATVLLSVAMIVAVAATVSAVVYGVLFRPLPYDQPDRIVRVWERHEGATPGFPGEHLSDLTYHAIRDAAPPSVLEIGAFQYRSHLVSGTSGNDQLDAAALTPSLVRVLRLDAALGRFFIDEDVDGDPRRVVVLGHQLWLARFGSDRSVLGQTLVMDGVGHEIVGVAPSHFAFPLPDTALYTPLAVERPAANRLGLLSALARLADGGSPERLAGETTAIARATDRPMVADVMFGKGGPVEVHAQTMGAQMTAKVRPALLTLGAAVVLLLMVGCATVATLALAHGAGRRQELGVRASLGATRARLLRQLLTENLALCAVGGALGVAVGVLVLRSAAGLLPLPRLSSIQVDWAFAAGAVACVVAIAVVAAAVTTRDLTRRIAGEPGGTASRTVSAGRSRLRQSLLVVEAALAVVLLVGGALLLRSFVALVNVDAGYDPTQVVTASLHVAEQDAAGKAALVDAVLDRLRAREGVHAAGIGSMAPFGGSVGRFGFQIPESTTADGKPVVAHTLYSVITHGYIEALGMRVVTGRAINADDRSSPVRAMLVNETFARTYLDDGRPVVGRRFPSMVGGDPTIIEVVGIVADVLPTQLDATADAHIYVAHGGSVHLRHLALVVRASDQSGALLRDIRSIVGAVAPDVALEKLGPLEEKLATSVATPRIVTIVLITFAVLALTLAAAGLYGVLSHMVTSRSRELGIRAALGARRATLLAMVLRQGLETTVVGLGIGLVGSAMLARALESQLFGIAALDPVAFVVAPLVLIGAATAACLLPARRAAASNPIDTLRSL